MIISYSKVTCLPGLFLKGDLYSLERCKKKTHKQLTFLFRAPPPCRHTHCPQNIVCFFGGGGAMYSEVMVYLNHAYYSRWVWTLIWKLLVNVASASKSSDVPKNQLSVTSRDPWQLSAKSSGVCSLKGSLSSYQTALFPSMYHVHVSLSWVSFTVAPGVCRRGILSIERAPAKWASSWGFWAACEPSHTSNTVHVPAHHAAVEHTGWRAAPPCGQPVMHTNCSTHWVSLRLPSWGSSGPAISGPALVYVSAIDGLSPSSLKRWVYLH